MTDPTNDELSDDVLDEVSGGVAGVTSCPVCGQYICSQKLTGSTG